MFNFTVISFYTPDWRYPAYAQSLASDCERLGVPSIIEQRNSTGSYRENCNIKPEFIRDKLRELKQPVLWMDVDGSVLRLPQELSGPIVTDIVGYQNQGFPERIYVCTLLFNYTPVVLDLVDLWCDHSKNSIDDGAFNDAIKNLGQDITIKTLPAQQIAVSKIGHETMSDELCFVHRISNSDIKQQYKNSLVNQPTRDGQ